MGYSGTETDIMHGRCTVQRPTTKTEASLMYHTVDTLSEEEFDQLFFEALYAFDGANLFFRKAKHGHSFIRGDC